MTNQVLIIEDGSGAGVCLDRFLSREAGYCCQHFTWDPSTSNGLRVLNSQLIVVFAVAEPAWTAGLFGWLSRHPLAAPVLAVLPGQSSEDFIRQASEVADDFIFWPASDAELHRRARRLIGPESHDCESVSERLTQELGLAQLVGRDAVFLRAIEKIPLIAANNAPVLLSGETGTGKELCARAIHHLSKRRDHPFIPVDCGAIPEHLAENELFGHARGAFTDAHVDQKGLAAMAEGGTLFLDEIDALSLAAQAKVLRFIQEGTYRPLGAERLTQGNVRVVAATNRDLESCIREKQFRADLYFRLSVLELHLPPLRERRGDIALLAHHIVESLCREAGQGRKFFSPGALRMLESYDWPGNIRQLFNVVQRSMVFYSGAQILPGHISLPAGHGDVRVSAVTFREARANAIGIFERAYVEVMLRKHGGNITRAASEAGKDRRAFGRLVKKYAIDRKFRAPGRNQPGI